MWLVWQCLSEKNLILMLPLLSNSRCVCSMLSDVQEKEVKSVSDTAFMFSIVSGRNWLRQSTRLPLVFYLKVVPCYRQVVESYNSCSAVWITARFVVAHCWLVCVCESVELMHCTFWVWSPFSYCFNKLLILLWFYCPSCRHREPVLAYIITHTFAVITIWA